MTATTALDHQIMLDAPGEDIQGTSMPLGEQLRKAGLITSDELETALHRQHSMGVRLGDALVQLGLVAEESILPFIQRQLQLPAVRLRDGVIDPAVTQLLPQRIAEAHTAIALFRVRGTLTVAMTEPQQLHVVDELASVTGLKIRPVFAFSSAIHQMIRRCYAGDFEVDTVTADLDDSAIELMTDALEWDLESIEAQVEGSPIIKLVNFLVVSAIQQSASDIHIEPDRRHTMVRFRIDGHLRDVLRPRRDLHPAIISRIKVMAKMDIAERRRPQDGRIHVAVEGREIDLRVSTLPTVLGEKVVMRVLDRARLTFNLNELGIPTDQLIQVKRMLARPYGLILVTGPTGSGKTTTLYSALELIKSVSSNIVTVEDPVEYQLELINQVQANTTGSLGFPDALRSILRQDPDVIMVGEIRDVETAQVAVQAALTGHLVLSTLHTNDSAGAVVRLLDMGVAPYQVASALVGIVAQRLCRLICPECRTTHFPPSELLASIRYAGDQRRPFVRGEGCPSCHDSGYQGRMGLYEVMTSDQELRELITNVPTVDQVRGWHRAQGGQTVFEEGVRLAEEGQTDLTEVMRIAFFE